MAHHIQRFDSQTRAWKNHCVIDLVDLCARKAWIRVTQETGDTVRDKKGLPLKARKLRSVHVLDSIALKPSRPRDFRVRITFGAPDHTSTSTDCVCTESRVFFTTTRTLGNAGHVVGDDKTIAEHGWRSVLIVWAW